jgi:uncharacterized phage protein gp47/JayE
MAFQPRTFEAIRDDMIAYVRLQTDLTDFEIGSVIRTIIEAAALEDDEQYFQMVQLLDAFRLSSASGSELDSRVAEFDIVRLQPASATADVTIRGTVNVTIITAKLGFNHAFGALLLKLDDSSKFPTTGFPYTVRVGEGTVYVEDVAVTANDGVTQLTLAAPGLVNAHTIGARASRVTGANRQLLPGIRVQVPATGSEQAVVFVTVESGTLIAGNYESTAIRARAEIPGTTGNIGANKITQFVGSPPFDGATVSNPNNAAGGRDLESDADLRDRARASIQSLSRATVLALRECVLGVFDAATGQRVTTANILEDFVANEVIVYVDDGTGFIPDTVVLAESTLSVAVTLPSLSLLLVDATGFPEEGFVMLSPEDLTQTEILPYASVDHGSNSVTLTQTTAKTHNLGDSVLVVDVLSASAEDGERFFQAISFPIVRSTFRLWTKEGSSDPVLRIEGDDYILNRGTGQIEFIIGVAAGTLVVANYTYYTALIADVQKVIDGDLDDPTTFPGVRAAGIRVVVETPVIRRISVRASITAKQGFQESELAPLVQETVESYVNGLGIGDDFIVAEVVKRAMEVNGVGDIHVVLPTENLVVLENELARPVEIDGTSLVIIN